MNDTDVFHAPHRPSRAARLIGAWRGAAQLGMLRDGRAHTWTGEAPAPGVEPRKSPANHRAADTPRLGRLLA